MKFPSLFPQTEAIRLYCGSCEQNWHGDPVDVGPFACVSPVYGKTLATKSVNRVHLSETTRAVIQDSGAFCDGPGQRLSFAGALERQIEHARRFGYAHLLTHRASYDVLVDEVFEGIFSDQRRFLRWSEHDAWDAVHTTIQAARYLDAHRYGLHCILSAQGVNTHQYLTCVQEILPYLQEGDMLGLGGFCIVGLRPKATMPVFREIIHELVPYAGRLGVSRIHIWGCVYAPALGELLSLCDQYGIALSTDSVGPSLRPVFGRWGYSSWAFPAYQRPPRGPLLAQHRALHVSLVREWLCDFRERETQYYRYRPSLAQQSLF
ncbi:MAG: hypothetical protein NVSMB38_40410 [Ktedonobacteraceae bacterium]